IGEKVELNEYLRDEYCAKSQQSCSPVRPTRGNVYATNRGKKQNVFSPKTWNCFNPSRNKWLYVPNDSPGNDTFSTVSRDNTKLTLYIVIERRKLVERTCVTKTLIELNATIGRTLDITSYLKNGFCTTTTAVSNECLPVKPSVGTVKGKRRYTRRGTFEPFVTKTCFKPNIYRWTYVASESTSHKEDSFSVILANNEKLDFKITMKVEPWFFPIFADEEGRNFQNNCQVTEVVYLNVTATKAIGLTKYMEKERCTGTHGLCSARKPSQGALRVKGSDPFKMSNLGNCWNATRLKWTYTSMNDRDGQDEFSIVSLGNTERKFVISIIKESTCVLNDVVYLNVTATKTLDITEYLGTEYCTGVQNACSATEPLKGDLNVRKNVNRLNPFEITGCFNPKSGYKWTYTSLFDTSGQDVFSVVSKTGTILTFNISISKDCILQKGESKRVTVHVLGEFILKELTPDAVCTKVQTTRTCRI
ncbi:unnamed protein product, partial [Owenia fusiformis]